MGQQDGQARRRKQGRADSLDRPGGDERPGARGNARGQGADGEDEEAGQEGRAVSEEVGEAAAQGQQGSEGDEVGVDDPGQTGRREVQVLAYVGQGDVHDGGVEHDEELRAGQEGEEEPWAVRA
nr:hypothetical protein [Streptomyces sp. SKN60]